MTDYEDLEEWEDEGDLDELEEEDERLAAIHAEVQRFERENGLTLSDEDYQRMALLGDLYSIPPSQAFAETEAARRRLSWTSASGWRPARAGV
jgi:hypothetical protein